MKFSKTAIIAAVALLGSQAALAQGAARNGTVTSVEGPAGSVLVVRGSEVFTLSAEDALFSGDQVFTRSNGGAELQFSGCTKTLQAASSITVNATVCDVVPVVLSGDQVIAGVQVGATGVGGIGATGGIAGALAAAALVSTAGGDGSPSSP